MLLADRCSFTQWKWGAGISCGVLLLVIILAAVAAGGGGGAKLPDTGHAVYARFLIVGGARVIGKQPRTEQPRTPVPGGCDRGLRQKS